MTLRDVAVIIPVYNEAATVQEILKSVAAVGPGEILVVDDGSTDGTRNTLEVAAREGVGAPVRVFHHPANRGKGAAVRTALEQVRHPFIVIQDADLEYDPAELPGLLEPLLDGRTSVLYGTRFAPGYPQQARFFWHYIGNRFLTALTNLLFGSRLTDMETGTKAFRADVLQDLPLKARRFDFEPEVTAELLKRNVGILERPISYRGRDYRHGKKIKWWDGFEAVWRLFRCRFRR